MRFGAFNKKAFLRLALLAVGLIIVVIAVGGYWLNRPPAAVTVADVIRAVEGPLASVRGQRPEDVGYDGNAAALQDVWIAVRASLRAVAERVTLADLATPRASHPHHSTDLPVLNLPAPPNAATEGIPSA